MTWMNNLDFLAQNGVLDFDAPAYILGRPPRYVGNPSNVEPMVLNPPQVIGTPQPESDEFVPSEKKNNNLAKPASWKKWLFGFVAAGALIFGGFKFKSKLVPWVKNLNIKQKIIEIPKKIGKFFKKGWNKIFKNRTP